MSTERRSRLRSGTQVSEEVLKERRNSEVFAKNERQRSSRVHERRVAQDLGGTTEIRTKGIVKLKRTADSRGTLGRRCQSVEQALKLVISCHPAGQERYRAITSA